MPNPPNGNNRQQINNARDALVGIIPDPKGQVEQITTALVYKYLDKLDSDSVAIGGRRTYFVGSTAEFSWKNLLAPSLTGDQRLQLYRRAVEGMAESGKLGEVFGEMMRGASSPFQNARVLQTFLHAIDELDCDNTENLGDAYEHLLSIMGTQKDAGQFRTPRHIIDFIVAAVAPQKNERVLDPACGSAGFLAAAHAHVMRHGGSLSPADKRKLAQNIVGHDIDPGMVRLAMVNLYLHKIKNPRVREYDSLSDDSLWEERANVILANPPFMTPLGGIQPHGRFMVRANRAEVLFVDYIAEHLSPQGRAGIVVPEGIIFKAETAYKTLRKMLVEDWGLWAVASLPSGVFQPYSGVPTSVLFLDKTRRHFKNVLLLKVQNDGFDSGANRNPIDENDLPAVLKIMRGYNDEKKVGHPLALAVAKTKIAEDGDYSLVANKYREVAAVGGAFPMMALGEVAEYARCKVQKFEGEKVYFATKDIGIQKINGHSVVSFDNRPSRADCMPKINDVGFALMKNTKKVFIVNESISRCIFSTGFGFLRPSEKIVPLFLLYLVISDQFHRAKDAKTPDSIMSAIRPKAAMAIKVPVPSLEEQIRIVAEIDDYAKVRDGADAVVQNWRPTVKISPAWPVVKLGSVCLIEKGQTPRVEWYAKKGAHIIKYRNVKASGINWLPGRRSFVDISHVGKLKRVQDGMTMVTADAHNPSYIGREVAFVDCKPTSDVFYSGELISVLSKDEKTLANRWAYLFLSSVHGYSEIQRNISGGHLNKGPAKEILIPLPPLAEQERIIAEVEAERRAVSECRALSATMEQKITNTIARIWEDKP